MTPERLILSAAVVLLVLVVAISIFWAKRKASHQDRHTKFKF